MNILESENKTISDFSGASNVMNLALAEEGTAIQNFKANQVEQNTEQKPFEQIIKNTSQEKITLTRNSKGYTWEIAAHADTLAECIDMVIAADQRLKDRFGGN